MFQTKSIDQKKINNNPYLFINLVFAFFPISFILGSFIVSVNLLLLCCLGIYYLRSKILSHQYDFPIKIIGIVSEEFTSIIVDIIQKHLPKFDAHKIEMKGSSGGKYISLTCTLHVVSKNQLDDIYRELSSHPMTKFVL